MCEIAVRARRVHARKKTAVSSPAIKAGKIYVPLDPTEAPDRIAGKLHDAGAPIIFTDAANRDTARAFASQQRTVIEVERAVATSETTDPDLSHEPDRPVYIYYTSGSTGAPKGVFDDHRNVLHNVLRYTNTLAIGTDDRMSLIQSPSFSGTVSSIFSALLNGAAIYPCPASAPLRQIGPIEQGRISGSS